MIAAFLFAVVRNAARSSARSLKSDLASIPALDTNLEFVVLVIFGEGCADVILPVYWLFFSSIFFLSFVKLYFSQAKIMLFSETRKKKDVIL